MHIKTSPDLLKRILSFKKVSAIPTCNFDLYFSGYGELVFGRSLVRKMKCTS